MGDPHDVVHQINECIRILESPTPTPHFSKLEALRFLVHLVGDVHQPLHVGTVDANQQLTQVNQQVSELSNGLGNAANVLSQINVAVGVLDELLKLAASFH